MKTYQSDQSSSPLLKSLEDRMNREGPLVISGGEAIYRDGKLLGSTTSGGYGHSIGKTILMGYIPVSETLSVDFEIEAFGKRIPARQQPHNKSLYDPKRERLLS